MIVGLNGAAIRAVECYDVIHGHYVGDRYSYPCSRASQKYVPLLCACSAHAGRCGTNICCHVFRAPSPRASTLATL